MIGCLMVLFLRGRMSHNRHVCATEVVSIKDRERCYKLIVSAIAKMMEARPRRLSNPFEGICSRELVVLKESSFVWEPLDKKCEGPKWTTMPMESAKNFYVLKSFASSERSRVLLACTVSGAVCVIKFLRYNGLNSCVISRIDIDHSCNGLKWTVG
jgi:hypothetical protein